MFLFAVEIFEELMVYIAQIVVFFYRFFLGVHAHFESHYIRLCIKHSQKVQRHLHKSDRPDSNNYSTSHVDDEFFEP